jgi:hypothetical protein
VLGIAFESTQLVLCGLALIFVFAVVNPRCSGVNGLMQELVVIEGGSEGLYEGSSNMGRLTFRCLTGRDGRCLGLGFVSQGLGIGGLRWERTW